MRRRKRVLIFCLSSLFVAALIASRTLFAKTLYIGAAALLLSISGLARLGSFCYPELHPELIFFSQLSSETAQHAIHYACKNEEISPPDLSWRLNKKRLAAISADSQKDKQLLLFLQRRWLAKQSGFNFWALLWAYPCFGISMQTNPETTRCYARDPGSQPSQTYQKRIAAWKQSLPHPISYPLILTNSYDIYPYLPPKLVIDCTDLFPPHPINRAQWLEIWKKGQPHCSVEAICIQRVKLDHLGAIRILPLEGESELQLAKKHQVLLEWVSHFGLTANQIELDREQAVESPTATAIECRLELPFQPSWQSAHPQKNLLYQGTLATLQGLFEHLPQKQWITSPTRLAIAQLSLQNIQDILTKNPDEGSFFDAACHIEQIHANLCPLLEIFSPFSESDFAPIYLNVLPSIPAPLKALTTCGLHTSAMTSIAGIFRAVATMTGKAPHILCGENCYFECIHNAQQLAHVTALTQATEQNWEEADLILAQFNPALRRIDEKITAYRIEPILELLHRRLHYRKNAPLTLALDCTFDYIDSPRIGHLLCEFQQEIKQGLLNIICYRSGAKFDLFGLDHYCGAPFYMIHNQDPIWAPFEILTKDPALQTDRLSLNWFCLAYKTAAKQLDAYRSQIFENTKALLSKIPPSLYDEKARYRMIPMQKTAELSFVDFKVSGPFHQLRASALVGGLLFFKFMQQGYPLFNRRSLGYYHSNFGVLFGKQNSTIRLTLGLDPAQIDVCVACFEAIDKLNRSREENF